VAVYTFSKSYSMSGWRLGYAVTNTPLAETLGKMMWWCGEDKIIYGGETPIWHPQWALEEFWNFELPRDIVEERGYPQLTEQAKRKILGENLLRLHGITLDEAKAKVRA